MAPFFAVVYACVALSQADSLQGLYVLNYCREAFLVDPHYVQPWNWFVATNILAPSRVQHILAYPRRTFTSTLIAGIMHVRHSWHHHSHFLQNLDAEILKANMLLILQYVSFPSWSCIDRQLQGHELSLDIDELNEDTAEQRGYPLAPPGNHKLGCNCGMATTCHDSLVMMFYAKCPSSSHAPCVRLMDFQLVEQACFPRAYSSKAGAY